MPTKNKELTDKQKKFCKTYLATKDINKSMEAAGYKANASEVFKLIQVYKHLVKNGIPEEHIQKCIKQNKPDTTNLTMKELKFCNLYLACGNINKSALEAGYSIDRHGHAEIILRPHIVNYLKKRRRHMERLTNIDFAWKVDILATLIKNIVNEDGVDKQYASVVVAAIRTLNDMQGHNSNVSYVPSNYKDDEDVKKIRELTFKILEERKNSRTIEYDQYSTL
jgi:phage terminase small subunit